MLNSIFCKTGFILKERKGAYQSVISSSFIVIYPQLEDSSAVKTTTHGQCTCSASEWLAFYKTENTYSLIK